MQSTSSNLLSAAATKRIIALVLLIATILLIGSLVSDSIIVGNWKLENPNVANAEIEKYCFNDNGTGTVSYQAAENSPARLVKNFGYSFVDGKLIINLDGEKTVYNTTRSLNYINLNDQKSLNYDDSFTPMLRIVVIVLLAFVFLWAIEDDFNALTRAAASKRKEMKASTKRILAIVMLVAFFAIFILATLPSLRIAGEWKSPDNTALYTFKMNGNGTLESFDDEGNSLGVEKFTYTLDQKPGLFSTIFAEGPKMSFGLVQGDINLALSEAKAYKSSFVFNTLNFEYIDANELDAKGQPVLKKIVLKNQDLINPTLCIVVAFVALFLASYFIQDDIELSKRNKQNKAEVKKAQKAKKARSK